MSARQRHVMFQSGMPPVATSNLVDPFYVYRSGAQVGPRYTTAAAAVAVALSGDTIKVIPGSYVGQNLLATAINVATLTIESAVAGVPAIFALSGYGSTGGEHAFVLGACTNLTVRDIPAIGTQLLYEGGSGGNPFIGIQGGADYTLLLERCGLYHFSNGIFGGTNRNGTITMNDCVVENCMGGDGLSHGVYISRIDSFTARGTVFRTTSANTFINSLDNLGHLFKSRAKSVTLDACVFDGAGGCSRPIDISNGGTLVMRGCVAIKYDDGFPFGQVLAFGPEQTAGSGTYVDDGRVHSVTLAQNTLVARTASSTILQFGTSVPVANPDGTPATITKTIRNNIVAGATASSVTTYPNNSEVATSQIDASGHCSLSPIAGTQNDAAYEFVGDFQTPTSRVDSTRGAFLVVGATIQLDINSSGWWLNCTRTNMEYSGNLQHTNGRHLELSMAQHDRAAGDNVGVRYAEHTSSGPLNLGHYWPSDDPLIAETDNFPTFYVPSKQWVGLYPNKIIDMGTPAAIFRSDRIVAGVGYTNAAGQIFSDYCDITIDVGVWGGSFSASDYLSNYNPACLVNPDSNWTCYFGGGVFNNYPNGHPAAMKLIDENPNYPATSTKPLRMRVFVYDPGGAPAVPAPIVNRHAVKIGNYIYWGGGGVLADESQAVSKQFYRIYVPNLLNSLTVTQERITDAPFAPTTSHPFGRFPVLAADVPRKRAIVVNGEGIFRYQIPSNDGNNGIWTGPFRGGLTAAEWRATVSDNNADVIAPGSVTWHGLVGSHSTTHNQTFFRYVLSRKWNRIVWGD